MPHQPRQDLQCIRLDAKFLVDRLKPFRRQSRVIGLVVFVYAEADGERSHRAGGQFPHQADDDARIDAPGKEGPQFPFALQSQFDARPQQAAHLFCVLRRGQVFFALEVRLPIRPHFEAIVAIDGVVGGRELVDAAKNRLRMWHILIGQIGVDGLRADLPRHARRLQQAFQLAGKQQPAGLLPIDQRLLAQPIPGQQQESPRGVPKGQGEHAVELL